jgi:hypothetical protein
VIIYPKLTTDRSAAYLHGQKRPVYERYQTTQEQDSEDQLSDQDEAEEYEDGFAAPDEGHPQDRRSYQAFEEQHSEDQLLDQDEAGRYGDGLAAPDEGYPQDRRFVNPRLVQASSAEYDEDMDADDCEGYRGNELIYRSSTRKTRI